MAMMLWGESKRPHPLAINNDSAQACKGLEA